MAGPCPTARGSPLSLHTAPECGEGESVCGRGGNDQVLKGELKVAGMLD